MIRSAAVALLIGSLTGAATVALHAGAWAGIVVIGLTLGMYALLEGVRNLRTRTYPDA